MSYIPDTSKEIDELTHKPNPYYEGNLNKLDKAYIEGYTDCIEAVISAFYNLDIEDSDLRYAGFNTMEVQDDILAKDEKNDLSLSDYEMEDRLRMSDETKLCIALRNTICEFLMYERNEAVVSLIENESGGNDSD